MKFKFCGDLDAPDWILREIAVLAKISSVRMKVISVQVLENILGKEIDYAKCIKLVSDSNLEVSDVKAVISAVHFIVSNAAKYDLDDLTLSNELTQLGLPKEHCDALGRAYSERKDRMRQKLFQNTLKLPRLESVEWRVDYILSSSTLSQVNHPSIQLNIKTKELPGNRTGGKEDFLIKDHPVDVSTDKFLILLNELKEARALMDDLQ
eukprot:TRINITY_DN1600_c0_g1_i2.p1 TRINITY_DN1600_c0_g1~~TRINITY_DN1600_c0_g1_i2.p1  ORF type:complete len:208 (+),score=49.79 TRINITY_DN1600_c0_g1_i2:71-694(+)